MAKSVVIKVSLQAVESEPIDSKFKEVQDEEVSGLDFLNSEIPGVPGIQFKDAVILSYRTNRQRLLQRILDKVRVAAVGEPKNLILIIEDIP